MRSIVFDSVIIVVFLHFITRKNFFNIRFFTVFCPSLPFLPPVVSVFCRPSLSFLSAQRFRFLPLVVSFFSVRLFRFCRPSFLFFLSVSSVFCRSSLPNDKRKEKRQEGRARNGKGRREEKKQEGGNGRAEKGEEKNRKAKTKERKKEEKEKESEKQKRRKL